MAFGLPTNQDKRGILSSNFDNTFNTLYPAGNKPDGFTPEARQFTVDITGVGGTIGVQPEHPSGVINSKDVFTSDAGSAIYTDEVLDGTDTTIKTVAADGTTGFGSFGGIYSLGTNNSSILQKGDEFWVRTKFYRPAGAGWNLNGANKFQRNRVYDATKTTSRGYLDTYYDHERTLGQWKWIYEGEQTWEQDNTVARQITNEAWHTVETYIRLDEVSEDLGGVAKIMVWVDDKLILSSTARRTLNEATDIMTDSYLFTYWDNNTVHPTETVYIAQHKVTSIRPSTTDAFGNYYHGVQGGNE